MRIGVDIDNVISNFNEILLKEYLLQDKKYRNSGIINKDVYIRKGMFDWSKEEEESFYLNNIERIASNLEVIDGAKDTIDKLRRDGHEIYIISGRNNGEYSDPFTMTKDWLHKHHISYDQLILTNAYFEHEKTEACLKNNIQILIDDSVRTCLDAKQHHITTLLMDDFYNRKNTDLYRVYSWKEIYTFISNYHQEKLNVILDTDIGNECDDQFALSYLLKSQDVFNIEAITIAPYSHKERFPSVEANQENSFQEITKICEWLNFDFKNKIFKGATDYMANGYEEENDAVKKIIEIAQKNKKTYIMAIGTITNISLAIKKEPKIVDKIEVIWLAGHSLLQDNNIEYNFKKDLRADRILFDSEVKLTIIPCKNVASALTTSVYELEHYLKDKSQLATYLIQHFSDDGYHEIKERRVLWDISVVAYLINKSWFNIQEVDCPKIKDDTSYKLEKNNRKITMVNDIDVNKVYTDLFRRLGEKNESVHS